ncbi:MAG: hypothetical protein KGI97_04005 [Alphaproteobacteria bacterium]|nr:hypothetical protein [Alphaproteobacteria bacterium]
MTRFAFALLLLGLFAALPVREAHAAAPSFALTFAFKPALSQGPTSVPEVFLDSCSDQSCSMVRASAPLNCTETTNGATGLAAVRSCSIAYALHRGRGNPALAWLAHGSVVRLRDGARMSQPFFFSGGVPSVPKAVYRYIAHAQNIDGMPVFAVQPQ